MEHTQTDIPPELEQLTATLMVLFDGRAMHAVAKCVLHSLGNERSAELASYISFHLRLETRHSYIGNPIA